VAKRQKRLTGVDEMVISLAAKGLTTGEVSARLAEVYGAEVSRQTISTITDKVLEGVTEWQNRPLDPVYPVIFIDAIHVRTRDGQVANRPIYVALAMTCEGCRDILGLWAGDGGEGAKYWLHVMAELKNRGVADVLMVVCDGLTGLPDAISTVWPATITQTCIVHLLRNSFRYAGRQHWDAIAKALKPVYTALTEAAAHERFAVGWSRPPRTWRHRRARLHAIGRVHGHGRIFHAGRRSLRPLDLSSCTRLIVVVSSRSRAARAGSGRERAA
jgi:putative transposase